MSLLLICRKHFSRNIFCGCATQIEEHAEDGPATKLHRWIGFVQGAMLANRMLDLDGLKAMFDDAKAATEKRVKT